MRLTVCVELDPDEMVPGDVSVAEASVVLTADDLARARRLARVAGMAAGPGVGGWCHPAAMVCARILARTTRVPLRSVLRTVRPKVPLR